MYLKFNKYKIICLFETTILIDYLNNLQNNYKILNNTNNKFFRFYFLIFKLFTILKYNFTNF